MNRKTNQPTPVKETNRIVYLDILRGIAIFFIFCANSVWFSGYYDFPKENILPAASFWFDTYFELMMYTLVDGKFYSIFSLLFGIGCAIQHATLLKHNKPFAPFFRRRMLWLLVIGLIHLLFLWIGDILTLYALLGLILIWFVKLTNKQLLTWAIILITMPLFNWILINSIGWNYPSYFYDLNIQYNTHFGIPMYEWNGVSMTDFLAYITNDNLFDFFITNIGNSLIRCAEILNEGRAFKVLGIFFIGLWTGRKILNENLLDNTSYLKRVAILGFCIGFPNSIFRTWITINSNPDTFWSFLKTVSYALGTVPLALSYAAILALIYKKHLRFLNVFAIIGKTALSNYLLQTVLATTLFYGIGFGLGGKFGYTVIIGIEVLLFFFQFLCSKLWLKRYKYGPMEWIWRQLTYGKRIRLKKQ